MKKERHHQLVPLLCAISCIAGGCNLDGNKIEASIREKFAADGIELTSIDCPDDRKQAQGDEFDCQGKSELGDAFLVHVKQTNDQGTVSWTFDGVIVDPKRLFKGAFDCGDKKFIAVKGTKMTCKLRERSVDLVFIDDKGGLDESSVKALVEQ